MKSTKRIVFAVVAVVMIVAMVAAFTACDTGKYVNGDSYVKLKMGGKFEAHFETTVLGVTVTKELSGTYEIAKADDDGNKVVTFTITSGDDSYSLDGAYINSDGQLIVLGATYEK